LETIECKHQTKVTELGHGLELLECTICHQKVQINVDKLAARPIVTKLGRIGDKIVIPNSNYKLQLLPGDQADLAAAIQGTKAPGKEDARARLKRYREHKHQMIDDLITLGKDAFLKKWEPMGVKPQIISHLKSDDYYKQKVAGAPPPQSLVSQGDKIPALPPWNDNWVPEVQIKWLAVYETLLLNKE